MKTKYLNTLIAITVLAALWGGLNYYGKRKGTTSDVDTEKSTSKPPDKLVSIDSKHIKAFTVKPRDAEAFTLVREGGTWSIVEPKKYAADQSGVTSLLDSVTDATVSDVVDPHPASLKDYGLDAPVTTIDLTTDTKPEKVTVLVGDETPTSTGVYAQAAGNPRVVTLASYLKSSLEKKLFDLRDKRVVTLNADQIQKIEAESKGKHFTLVKNPEGVWDLVLPPPVRADKFTVDGMVNQLRNMNMQSVVAEDKSKSGQYGFGSPTLTVKLTSPGGSQSLVFGKKDGERYDAMNSTLDPVFTLDSYLLNTFQKDPADLRDKDLFSFSAFEAKRLEVDTPQGHRVFEQQKDKWKQTSPSAKDIPSDKMQALLSDLRAIRATSFPKDDPENLAAFGLTKPAYRFQVQFGDKNQKEIVEAGKTGDHLYARRSTDQVASELQTAALDSIEKALNSL